MSQQQVDAIVNAALSTDEQLVAAARELTGIAITEIHGILKFGTPAAKQQILRSFIPALIKAGGEKSENQELSDLKDKFETFRNEMMGYEVPTEPPEHP